MQSSNTKLTNVLVERITLYSKLLGREVLIDAYLPNNVVHPENLGLLLINDGQDLPIMRFEDILDLLLT